VGIDHKRPMYAFVAVALICGLVIADQVRGEALNGYVRNTVVAGTTLHADLPALESLLPDAGGEPAADVVEPATKPASRAETSPSTAVAVVHQEPATQGVGSQDEGRGGKGNGPRTHGQHQQQHVSVPVSNGTDRPDPVVPDVPVVEEKPDTDGPVLGWKPPHSDMPEQPKGPRWPSVRNNGGSGDDTKQWTKPSWPQWPVRDTDSSPTSGIKLHVNWNA